MRSEIIIALAALACAGCAKTPRGTRPIAYRTPGIYDSRVHAAPVSLSAMPSPKCMSTAPKSVIYKRIPTEKDIRQMAQKPTPPQPVMGENEPPKVDAEKARLYRLLEMDMITREEYERRMGARAR